MELSCYAYGRARKRAKPTSPPLPPLAISALQRLVAERFFDSLPCIIVCGKGMPDMATRVLLHALHTAFPQIPMHGLVDWNPSGVNILCIYKYGSPRMLESRNYALCTLGWVGARAAMLEDADGEAFQVSG
jgi:meiotic recombination protein SPO11